MDRITDDFLRPWTLSQLAFMHTVAMEMITWGLTAEDVVAMVGRRFEKIAKDSTKPPAQPGVFDQKHPLVGRVNIQVCPDCGATCKISAVNISKCTSVGGDWNSVAVCNNASCRYTELSKKTVAEWRLK